MPSITGTRTAAVLLALGLASCAEFRSFQHTVQPYGGHDAAGADDQIYFALRNVKGIRGSGLGALQLPGDWPTRTAELDADGVGKLQPPVEAAWAFGEDLSPSAGLRPQVESTPGAQSLNASGDQNPLSVPVLPDVQSLKQSQARARERIDAGANAYALVLQSGAEERDPTYRLFGARSGEEDLEWVELMTLKFEDSRGGVARALDVPMREYPVIDIALITAALIWPVFLL